MRAIYIQPPQRSPSNSMERTWLSTSCMLVLSSHGFTYFVARIEWQIDPCRWNIRRGQFHFWQSQLVLERSYFSPLHSFVRTTILTSELVLFIFTAVLLCQFTFFVVVVIVVFFSEWIKILISRYFGLRRQCRIGLVLTFESFAGWMLRLESTSARFT